MKFSATQIEAITQGVLQQLRSRGVVVSQSANSPVANGGGDEKVTGGITLSSKVITEDMLAAADVAGKSVRIPLGSVITPSGHDYIRRHHVIVQTGEPTAAVGSVGTLITMNNFATAASAASTAKWAKLAADCEFQAAAIAQKHLPGKVVCCVAEPSTTACLLNRDRSIRAAVITENTDIGVLDSTMNPHVVCLNPIGWSFAALLRLLKQVSPGDAAPSSWKELS